MCDYSLTNVISRPAKVGDRLVVRHFGTGTRGFAPEGMTGSIDNTAVCVLPGTEIAFDEPITADHNTGLFRRRTTEHRLARFRQINKDKVASHHDALELPDGQQILLTLLKEGQMATVLQLPAAPKNEAEAKEQTRLQAVG